MAIVGEVHDYTGCSGQFLAHQEASLSQKRRMAAEGFRAALLGLSNI